MASIQLISEDDGPNSNVAVHVHATDAASTGNSLGERTEKSDVKDSDDEESGDKDSDDEDSDDEDLDDEDADDEARIPGDDDLTELPFCVTLTGPPKLSTKLQEKAMFWGVSRLPPLHRPGVED